jgi:anaerobic magnesium-protoporphyrin IX monomethyl ester cyclase
VVDVLLTHSYHLAYDRKQVRKMQPYPPLGTLYAAAVLRSRGLSVVVFDTMLQDPVTFPEYLRRYKPKLVVIYEDDFNFLSKMCLTRMREVAWMMTNAAHSIGATVVAHGSDASDRAVDYLQQGVNYVLLGEAEFTLIELCESVLRMKDTNGIAGLVSLDAACTRMLRNPGIPKPTPWHVLPAPARDLIDMEPYRNAWKASHGYYSLNLVASRGCPYRCNWCAKPISGDRFHVRKPDAVAQEIVELKDAYGAEHLWFGDDVFALDHRWATQFACEVEARRCTLPFKVQSRADLISAETADSLRRSGCVEVWMGVESGSQRVLDAMDKGLKIEEVVTATERLRAAGIRACYFLQFGYPGESWEEIQQTVSLVRATRPDDIGVSVSYPLPNTRFYEKVRAELGRKRNWTDSDDLSVMFKAAYTDEFYLTLRDALHAEVNSWHSTISATSENNSVAELWRKVKELEPLTRNADATDFCLDDARAIISDESQFIPLQQLSHAVREM